MIRRTHNACAFTVSQSHFDLHLYSSRNTTSLDLSTVNAIISCQHMYTILSVPNTPSLPFPSLLHPRSTGIEASCI